MPRFLTLAWLFLAASLFFSPFVLAQEVSLDVATRVSPPLVMQKNNELSGFSVEVWNEIAKRNDFKTNWVTQETVQGMLDAVKGKQVDLAISSISQTPARVEHVDFSTPYLNSGLQIISQKNDPNFIDLAKIFFNSGALKILLVGIILILLAAHIYWISKRLSHPKLTKNYFYWLWEGIWWGGVGLFHADVGEERPKTRRSQLGLLLWLFIGLIFLAQLEAVVTAQYTVDKLDKKISTLSDILSKNIGVVEGTTASDFAENQNLNYQTFPNAQEMLQAVSQGQVKAGISDVPIVQFYASHDGQGKVELGEILKKETYAIALPQGGELRQRINKTLLEMEQDGTLSRIQDKWFPPKEKL